MASVMITGSNRGIGLEFVKQLLAHSNPPAILIATCRKPEEAKELQAIAGKNQNLHILKLDVLDFDSLPAVAHQVEELVGDKGLNVLINNAGVLIGGKKDTLSAVNAQDMVDHYRTNTVAPVLLIKALLDVLKQAADKNKKQPIGWSRAAIMNISSILGSVSSNTTGSYWEYRESKAALNQASRSLAVELDPLGILIMCIHPGWVQTDMGTSAATLTPQESVGGMMEVLYGLGPDQQDSFMQWDGKAIPW